MNVRLLGALAGAVLLGGGGGLLLGALELHQQEARPPVLIVCDAEGMITQPTTLDAQNANAALANRRLQYRLGRLPWVSAERLAKADGCP